jgi:hypothetical protein
MEINTPMGQWSIQREADMMLLLDQQHAWTAIPTPKTMPAPLDGVMVDAEGEMVFVYETKCRDIDLNQLQQWGAYLISYDKIENGAHAARLLCVPFVVLVYCVRDNRVVSYRITDARGNITAQMDIAKTTTRKNINGDETIERWNAFIHNDHMKILW